MGAQTQVAKALSAPAGYKTYESMMVLRPDLMEEERDAQLAKVESILAENGAIDIKLVTKGIQRIVPHRWDVGGLHGVHDVHDAAERPPGVREPPVKPRRGLAGQDHALEYPQDVKHGRLSPAHVDGPLCGASRPATARDGRPLALADYCC